LIKYFVIEYFFHVYVIYMLYIRVEIIDFFRHVCYYKTIIILLINMTFNKEKPYNELPKLPTKTDIETKAILKAAIASRAALATTAALCKQLPNEAIFYNAIFLQEAKDSSEIENIITTNDDLYQAMSSDKAITNPNTREVLHYIDALWVGMKSLDKRKLLSTNTFIKMANTIKENNQGIREHPGVKIVNKNTKKVIYTPPEGKEIIFDKLKNLEEYINLNDDVDPLVKMAVIHYQFEAIHPFSDGNGRTGRIINILFLVLKDLLDHPMLFLSKYIIDNKNEYYIKLREVTEQNKWEEWILYMLKGIEETSIYTKDKITQVVDLMLETKHKMRNELPKIYSKELLEVLFMQPYCKISSLEDAGIAKRQTASEYLQKLEKIGLLKSIKVGKETLYVNKKFYSLLKD